MRRRSFLKWVCGAGAALFVPMKAGSVDAVFHGEPLASEFVPVGRTIWVDGSNVFPDGKDGTFERPYLTLRDALDSCDFGGTIYVKSGHVEQLLGALPEKRASIIGLGPDIPRFIWPTPS